MQRFIGLCLVLIFACQTSAQSAQQDTQLLTQPIRIVDEQGKPVQGAEARTGPINERYFFSIKGLNQIVTSDQDGLCEIPYPEMPNFPVESVTASVSHPDFCAAQSVVPIDPESDQPHEIRLKRGIKLTLSAINEDGEPTKSAFGILISGEAVKNWHRPEPHLAICNSLTSGNRQIMLLQQTGDGKRLFSDVLTQQFNQEKEPQVTLEDIELRPGVSIRGKLDENVTRPIKNGVVIACQAPLPAGNAWDEALPSLLYHDWVEIREDGTFEFPFMPDGGTIQLLGICDGWTGASDGSRVVGELFELSSNPADIELKMVPTFSVNIKVVDKQGKPVEDAQCVYSPNQGWYKSGSTLLGAKQRTAEYVLGRLKQFSESKELDSTSFVFEDASRSFRGSSDNDGNITLQNMPRNRGSQRIMISAPKPGLSEEFISHEERIELPADGENQVDVEVVLDLNSDSN
jgi:hypothetical protein